MKPDKKVCLYCGKQITGKKMYCDDAHRMAYKRTQSEPSKLQQPEQTTNPNTNKHEQIVPEQPTRTSGANNDEFRASLTKTDKTFYDRAMKDFGEPYYNFDWDVRENKCDFCGASYKTKLRLNRYCSYQHYTSALHP